MLYGVIYCQGGMTAHVRARGVVAGAEGGGESAFGGTVSVVAWGVCPRESALLFIERGGSTSRVGVMCVASKAARGARGMEETSRGGRLVRGARLRYREIETPEPREKAPN